MTDTHPPDWNPHHYAKHARFVSELGRPVVEWLLPRKGERILDLGCGDGSLTRTLLGFGCDVVGVDASPKMIQVAKSLGLKAEVMDGQKLLYDHEFDAVFSNAALHWMKKPEKVIAGVWCALKPGGRFVGELGGYGNVSSIVSALESALASRGFTVSCPWFFPQPEEYKMLLKRSGFTVERMVLFPRPTPLPGDVRGWLETFARPYTSVLPVIERRDLISEVMEALRPILFDREQHWVADYVRLRFSATKPRSEIASSMGTLSV